jgi:hypothetical protein
MVEVYPVVEALHLPILLLPQEDVLEAAGAQDPVTAAVYAKPQLTQQRYVRGPRKLTISILVQKDSGHSVGFFA